MLIPQQTYYDLEVELEDENVILYQGEVEGFVLEKTSVKLLVGLLSEWLENNGGE